MTPNKLMKAALACLAVAGLAACASAPTEDDATHGTVQRIINRHSDLTGLPPCMASQAEALAGGQIYVAIRYRHWASHFGATVFAPVPAGMLVYPGERLEIVPASCAANQLASIVRAVVK